MDHTHLDPARPAPKPSDPLHDLRSIGDYRILRRLGEGGMGAVYLGWREGPHDQVAVKVLNDQLASSQDYVDRFYREAKSGGLLNHPNIVRTFKAGLDRATNKHYLVLEFVDGPNALALLEKMGPLPIGDAVHIALDVARALEHAHSRNVVHRDIKPDNILITRAGVAKLVDLGLARRTDEASHLTAARQGFGTTHYMPYEQALNARAADGRSDVYALGATLYHLVTGQVPFPGDNHLDVVEKKSVGDFLPPSFLRPETPAALDGIVARMLARQPRDRYQTASELIVDLERSQLAAVVPSFADPDLAMKDPWIRALLASSAQPTRPDPQSIPQPTPEEEPDDLEADGVWVVRFRNRSGRLCRVKATTEQITERLRKGRLPARIEARRWSQQEYRQLDDLAEFRGLRPARRQAAPRKRAPSPEAPPPTPTSLRRKLLIAGAALAVVLAAAGILAWLFGFLPPS
jgi:serine/threonine-protein kinase